MQPTTRRRRPSYPPEAVGWFTSELGIGRGTRCCDLAAGTGKFTRLLLETGADCHRGGTGCRDARTVPRRAARGAAGRRERRRPCRSPAPPSMWCSSHRHGTGSTTNAPRPRCGASYVRDGGVGLVWNARDRSVAWVDRSGRSWTAWRSGRRGATTSTGAIPRRNCPDSRGHAPPSSGTTQLLTPEQVVQRFASVSHVAVLPDAERSVVLDEVRAVIDTDDATRGRTHVALPYRVDCLAFGPP